MNWGIALSLAIALVAAALYAAVARAVAKRPVGPQSTWANVAYAAGWGALAVMLATDAARLATGLFPPPSPALYLVLVQLKIFATAFAIAGFGCYVLFIHTGRRAWAWVPSSLVALVYAFAFLALTQARLPLTVEVGTWATRLRLQPGGVFPGGDIVGIALFFLPLLAITILYLALWRRLGSRMQHWRLLAVAVSLMVFLAASSVQSNPDISPDAPIIPLTLLIIGATGVFSLWSFQPPAWLRHRLASEAITAES